MKTTTIFEAYEKVLDDARRKDHLPHRRSLRQLRRFQAALVSRIEQGDLAREALQQVEWVMDYEETRHYCPWCDRTRHWQTHAHNCPRQLALGIKP